MKKLLKSNWFMLVFLLLAGGSLSMALRYDVLWDFANYHFFNPWAFLNGRVGYDIGVAGLNAFFNPLLDIPLYIMIKHLNDWPLVIYFVQGLWFGGLLFAAWKIYTLFFDVDTLRGKISIFIGLLIGTTGFSVFMQIGASSNEIPVALLVLSSFYLLLKEIYISRSGLKRVFFVCGLIMGAAMGLKLTAVTFCIASGLTLICFYKRLSSPWRSIAFYVLGGLTGFLLFNGFWMWIMWDKFHNPFFPFLNNVFESPYLSKTAFRDDNYVPKSISQLLLQPFIWAINIYKEDGKQFIVEYRYALVYLVLIGAAILSLRRKVIQNMTPELRFLSVFALSAYIIWLLLFNISRYFVAVEILLPIFVMKAFWYCFPKTEFKQIVYLSAANILLFQLISTPYYSDAWGMRREFKSPFIDMEMIKKGRLFINGYDKFLKVEKLKIPDNTLILMYNLQSAFALPLLAEEASGIRGVIVRQASYYFDYEGKKYDFYDIGIWGKAKRKIIENHQGPVIAFIVQEPEAGGLIVPAREKYLHDKVCRNVYNNLISDWTLCVPPELEDSIFVERRGGRYVK